ncbi:SDR family NAD(P)-dependent oxidoreductase [Flavihumibacter sp. CACIAM 22H1]|uniref:SDR family oxidoreductase n=1 Tax=Flavihumibacter sp. CACIAM 22H1 TaxID=1812911 RepID=UPI0007A9326A|nr:SDR family NAD(P)-dependent oxidoreductase [Flavihumibacter sp. CACIAM 22H1]KYP16373.1 MAG: oxidoreductase [Flavihumibacter sp. CACIAM 22H1]
MNLHNNTIFITGGSSGLGLEMAKQLIALNNTVLICGRNPEKLSAAKKQLPELITYCCDLSKDTERIQLSAWIRETYPSLNILVNNAAIVHRNDFGKDPDAYEKAVTEIMTNLLAPVHLSKLLLPVLQQNNNAGIINITSGLAYTPRVQYPVYNATKAALHSFTQVVRAQVSSLQITEVLFPVVDTPWHLGNPPKIAISPAKAVKEMLAGLSRNKKEIRVGAVKLLYYLGRLAPGFAFKKINSLH